MDTRPTPMAPSPEVVRLPHARDTEVVVLDGGTATALQRDGHVLDDALWSARLLLDDPEAIVAVHAAFLAAGAQAITTASYQLAETSLTATGRDPAATDRLLARSIELGHRAVARHQDRHPGPRPLVAASVGPFGAVRADGSEYRGHYGVTEDALVDFHAPRIQSFVAAGADVLACETLPSAGELAALARVLGSVALPAYVSVTLGADGTTTAEGQPLAEAFAPLLELDSVVAVGVNCCPPELVGPALEALAEVPRPLVVKPNVAERFDTTTGRWRPAQPDVGEGELPRAVETARWVAAGARLIGGCCGTGVDDLASLVRALGSLEGRRHGHDAAPTSAHRGTGDG